MRHARHIFSASFALTAGSWSAAIAADTSAAPGQGTLLVGAASHTVLPGRRRLRLPQGGLPGAPNAYDPGIPVPKWDAGRIAVGNGDAESYWVHDDIRATAMAIDDPRSADIVVIVATDLYMVFRNDAERIRAKAAQPCCRRARRRSCKIVVSASHNHHGPDTAFDVNHTWYEQMTDQVAAAVAAAVEQSSSGARLQVAAGEHWFGMNDGTDPQIFDPRLNVLQAVDTQGRVIATTVQWNNHPETTLGWPPPLDEIAADCVVLGLTGANCHAEGRYFTVGLPGRPARRSARALRRRGAVPERRARRADRPGRCRGLGGGRGSIRSATR